MNYLEVLNKLSLALTNVANKEEAVGMERYMKNNFQFLGVKQPLRKQISIPFIKELLQFPIEDHKQIVEWLWMKPQREFQYCALDFLVKSISKQHECFIEVLQWLITTKSWWDSVDVIAGKLVFTHLKRYPHQIDSYIIVWNSSSNLWLNRTAILFQMKCKKNTNERLLFQIILNHQHSKEFFIQKAIGWALREYSYSNPNAVLAFMQQSNLKPLSKREALKAIKRNGYSFDLNS